jgi:hypothetical protein
MYERSLYRTEEIVADILNGQKMFQKLQFNFPMKKLQLMPEKKNTGQSLTV